MIETRLDKLDPSRPLRRGPGSLGAATVQSVMLAVIAACAGGGQDATEKAPPADPGGERSEPEPANPVEAPDAPSSAEEAGLAPGHGRLVVTVEWQNAPAALRRAAGRSPCGHPRPTPIDIHTLGGVRHAVVWLGSLESAPGDGSVTDRPDPPETPEAPDTPDDDDTGDTGLAAPDGDPGMPTLTVRDCRMEPRVLLLPDAGARRAAALRIRNAGERRQRVVIHPFTRNREESSSDGTEVWLPIVGTQRDVAMPGTGIWLIRGGLDPLVASYVVVAGHERVTMTDDRGVATLPGVPGGEYQLQVWHPPARPGEPAIEFRQAVNLESGKVTTLEVSLAPAG